MNIIIWLSAGVVLGYFGYRVIWCGKGNEKNQKNSLKNNLVARVENKIENKQKILDLLERKEKIRNNQVEKLLGVSDTTVGRYLEELESEGKIKQIGNTGKSVYYIKTLSYKTI